MDSANQSSNKNISFGNLSPTEFLNIFSIPVVLGSVSTAFFFGRYFNAQLSFTFYWVLASTVWLIYTADHLLDGNRLKERAVFLRHVIHHQHRSKFWPALAALAVFNGVISLLFLPRIILFSGAVLLALVFLYFIFTHFFKRLQGLIKEIFVAVGAVYGMVILPGLHGNLDLKSSAIVVVMALLNLCNLLIFSYFDFEGDAKNNQLTSATGLGKEKSKVLIYNALGLAFTLFTVYLFVATNKASGIVPLVVSILLMLNVLLFLMQFEEKVAKKERYRLYGDLIFLIPGIVFLVLG
ncbi:MAG: 4-hydroxybenzoate polyprenyltransferase [Bacteroidia bacterium]|jgi:4-hydroxybenzoate polyprenyltransferase